MSTEKEIFVCADTEYMEKSLFLGTLHSSPICGKEISFEALQRLETFARL